MFFSRLNLFRSHLLNECFFYRSSDKGDEKDHEKENEPFSLYGTLPRSIKEPKLLTNTKGMDWFYAINRHFQWTLPGEALRIKFPNLSGELESSLHFWLESGEPVTFRFLWILQSNSPLDILLKQFMHSAIKNSIFEKNKSSKFLFYWVKNSSS